MLTWGEFRGQRPDLAQAGSEILRFAGIGLGFLSTVRKDGGPRLHPICPVIADDGLYGLIIPSPKLEDLRRDGRYALHSYPLPDNEDACYLTGHAVPRREAELWSRVTKAFVDQPGREGPEPDFAGQTLVEFLIETWLITRTKSHGDPNPVHMIWRAP